MANSSTFARIERESVTHTSICDMRHGTRAKALGNDVTVVLATVYLLEKLWYI